MFDSGIIVSCQPDAKGMFLFDAPKFAYDAQAGGAVAVRVEGTNNVRNTRAAVDIAVIGLWKTYAGAFVKITTAFDMACDLIGHGADYVAADATGRWGWTELARMANSFPIIGDVDSFENARVAQELGCVAVTTALSGYTSEPLASTFDPPDVDLVRRCVEGLSIPVIAEGRVWTVEHVKQIKDAGAHSVCIGKAITAPQELTRRYSSTWSNK